MPGKNLIVDRRLSSRRSVLKGIAAVPLVLGPASGLVLAGRHVFNPFDPPFNCSAYPADGTAALQAAVTAAQQVYGTVDVSDPIRITQTVTATDAVTIRGHGAPGDGERGYFGQNYYPVPTVLKGSVIVVDGPIDGLSFKTNKAVHVRDLQVSVNQGQAGSGRYAIRVASVSGAGNINSGTRLERLIVTNADYVAGLFNVCNADVLHVQGRYPWIGGIYMDTPNLPSSGGSLIDNFFVRGGAETLQFGILIRSQGGLRIRNPILWGGAGHGNGILFIPNFPVGQQLEPVDVIGGQIEGWWNGISAVKEAGDCLLSQMTIWGTEIWAVQHCIYTQAFQGQRWIKAAVIGGAPMLLNGDVAGQHIALDGVEDAVLGHMVFTRTVNPENVPVNAFNFGANNGLIKVANDSVIKRAGVM